MMVNAAYRDNRRISNVPLASGNTIWKDQWEFVSRKAGSDIFPLVMRLGFCTESFASKNERTNEWMNEWAKEKMNEWRMGTKT